MSETAEGVGGRKWSLHEQAGDGGPERFVMEGTHPIARLDYAGPESEFAAPRLTRPSVVKIQALLVTAPQLWDAANEYIKAAAALNVSMEAVLEAEGSGVTVAMLEKRAAAAEAVAAAHDRLANMVAKAVGKADWADVLQG